MNVFTTRHEEPGRLPIERLDEAGYESALDEAQRILDADPTLVLIELDAIIHGIRVRLHTNNPHWRRFWAANWFAPDQWATLTGGARPAEPQVHLYAAAVETETAPWAGFSRERNTGFLMGDTPYGPLRGLALGAASCALAEEEAANLVAGVCLKREGQGTLLLTAPDLDLAATIPALMEEEDTHLVALDGVCIRYGLVRMVDGVTLLPTLVIDEKGNTIPGYRLFPWLDEHGYLEPRADARCVTLEGEEVYCFARDLDLGRDPEAFAYPLEQAWYVPTQIAAAQPALGSALWSGYLENVPALTPELLKEHGEQAQQAIATLKASTTPSARSLLEEMGEEKVAEALCRLLGAPQGRAMVPPEHLWPGRAGGHPWRPLQIQQVAALDSTGMAPLGSAGLREHLIGGVRDSFNFEEDEMARTWVTMLGRAACDPG